MTRDGKGRNGRRERQQEAARRQDEEAKRQRDKEAGRRRDGGTNGRAEGKGMNEGESQVRIECDNAPGSYPRSHHVLRFFAVISSKKSDFDDSLWLGSVTATFVWPAPVPLATVSFSVEGMTSLRRPVPLVSPPRAFPPGASVVLLGHVSCMCLLFLRCFRVILRASLLLSFFFSITFNHTERKPFGWVAAVAAHWLALEHPGELKIPSTRNVRRCRLPPAPKRSAHLLSRDSLFSVPSLLSPSLLSPSPLSPSHLAPCLSLLRRLSRLLILNLCSVPAVSHLSSVRALPRSRLQLRSPVTSAAGFSLRLSRLSQQSGDGC